MITSDEAFERYGRIRKQNYLAHAIREIEYNILTQYREHYHIVTRESEIFDKSKCDFFQRGCIIRIPRAEKLEDKEIRIRLAHELGHIIYNLDAAVKKPASISKPNVDEEVFAWEFAYKLILHKSALYEVEHYKDYVISPNELKATICGIVKRSNNPPVFQQLYSCL